MLYENGVGKNSLSIWNNHIHITTESAEAIHIWFKQLKSTQHQIMLGAGVFQWCIHSYSSYVSQR